MDIIALTPLRNKIAIGLLFLAKFIGMCGIGIGFLGYRTLGGTMLAIDGILLVCCVLLCLLEHQSQIKQEGVELDMLEKMLADGTLGQRLEDIGLKLERKRK